MRILSVIAFVMMTLGSMGTSAQTVGTGIDGGQRAAQKTACERDARLIYKNGRDVTVERQQQVKNTRKAYVQDCLAKAGLSP